MKVIESTAFQALCEADGTIAEVDLMLVGEQKPGTWLLVFLNAAREVLEADEAQKIRDAHAALAQAMNGSSPDLGHYFADLVESPPRHPHIPAPTPEKS
jgi:hydrogenase expression/formation protein HypC